MIVVKNITFYAFININFQRSFAWFTNINFRADELQINHNFANTKNKVGIFAGALQWTEQAM